MAGANILTDTDDGDSLTERPEILADPDPLDANSALRLGNLNASGTNLSVA